MNKIIFRRSTKSFGLLILVILIIGFLTNKSQAEIYSFDTKIIANKFVDALGSVNLSSDSYIDFSSSTSETSVVYDIILPASASLDNFHIGVKGKAINSWYGINLQLAKKANPGQFDIIKAGIYRTSEGWNYYSVPYSEGSPLSDYLIDSYIYSNHRDPQNLYKVIRLKVAGDWGCNQYRIYEVGVQFNVDTIEQYFVEYYETALLYHVLTELDLALSELDICDSTTMNSETFKKFIRWTASLCHELISLISFDQSISGQLQSIFDAANVLHSDIFSLDFLYYALCFQNLKTSWLGPMPSELKGEIANLAGKLKQWALDWRSTNTSVMSSLK